MTDDPRTEHERAVVQSELIDPFGSNVPEQESWDTILSRVIDALDLTVATKQAVESDLDRLGIAVAQLPPAMQRSALVETIRCLGVLQSAYLLHRQAADALRRLAR